MSPLRPTSRPGLAWLLASGQSQHITRHGDICSGSRLCVDEGRGWGGVARLVVELLVGDVVWPDGSLMRAVPNDLLSLIWMALTCTCSSCRYSLSSARFKSAALSRQVHNLVRIVPKTLQRHSTKAELGQMERM